MSYLRNQPQATNDLSVSAPILQTNTNAADDSFGIDHYAFSDLTANNGKHNQVTTPIYVANPPTGLPPVTIADEPKIYAFKDSTNLGALNYSRGPSNAVPTPLTHLQSPSVPIVLASNATTQVLDFTGITRAICQIFMANLAASPGNFYNSAGVIWDGTNLSVFNAVTSGTLQAQISGTILQVKNPIPLSTLSNVYWTLQLLRLE